MVIDRFCLYVLTSFMSEKFTHSPLSVKQNHIFWRQMQYIIKFACETANTFSMCIIRIALLLSIHGFRDKTLKSFVSSIKAVKYRYLSCCVMKITYQKSIHASVHILLNAF